MPEREERGVSEHPEIDVLSAYVDGTLDDRDRAAVEAHVAECEACLELVTEVMHVQPDEAETGAVAHRGGVVTPPGETRRVLPFTRRRWVWAAAGLAAVLLLIVQVQRGRTAKIGEDRLMADLVTAVGLFRAIEPRLAGDFAYAPYRGANRAGSAETELPVGAAAAALQQRATREATASHRHAWGVAQIILGEIDGAIDTLEAARAMQPGDPAILSDLCAAHLTRSRLTGTPDDAQAALDLANAALQRQPTFGPALFNRALALETLRDDAEALNAWRALLAIEATSRWAEEARQHVSRLTAGRGVRLPSGAPPRPSDMRAARTS